MPTLDFDDAPLNESRAVDTMMAFMTRDGYEMLSLEMNLEFFTPNWSDADHFNHRNFKQTELDALVFWISVAQPRWSLTTNTQPFDKYLISEEFVAHFPFNSLNRFHTPIESTAFDTLWSVIVELSLFGMRLNHIAIHSLFRCFMRWKPWQWLRFHAIIREHWTLNTGTVEHTCGWSLHVCGYDDMCAVAAMLINWELLIAHHFIHPMRCIAERNDLHWWCTLPLLRRWDYTQSILARVCSSRKRFEAMGLNEEAYHVEITFKPMIWARKHFPSNFSIN